MLEFERERSMKRTHKLIGAGILIAVIVFILGGFHEHFFGRWDTQQQFAWEGKEFGARLELAKDGKEGVLTAQRKGQPGKLETTHVLIDQKGLGVASYIVKLEGELPLDFVMNQQGPNLLYCMNCIKAKGWQLPFEWVVRARN